MRTSCKMPRFVGSCLLLLSLSVLVVGCGKGSGVVSGKVYYKGQVLKTGTVGFFPEGKGGSFTSPISADGSYSIAKLPSGPAKISVLVPQAGPPQIGPQMGRGGQVAAKKGMEQQKARRKENLPPGAPVPIEDSSESVSIPQKYSDAENSGLKIDVTGGKQTFDIKIE